MEMTKGMDEGEFLEFFRQIQRLMKQAIVCLKNFVNRARRALGETLRAYIHSEITVVEQNHPEATYTKKFSEEDGQIFWEKFSAKELYRRWQAVTS